MTRYGRAHIKVSAILLGVVAIAGCSSSAKPAATTTTSTLPRATTTTTTRRRTETTTTTVTPTSASVTPTTRATTQSSAPSARAESATFVSPNHGVVLTADGHLDETTDGGRSWHKVGSLPVHGEPPRIRYIDAADGFAFGQDAGTPQFLITHDGGATWSGVPNAPFTEVGDLEIAHGMIYVAAMRRNDVDFHIWETPVEHLVWKEVPPNLSNSGGPVPIQQIVLTGGKGWIINQDRGVIAGARLTSTARWVKWTPPCLHTFGPANLSASTAMDIVASCDEGVWGGGHYSHVTPTFWISHNGGTTFARHAAPAFGPVLSPNPQTAIVAGGGGLQRTTDGGASWHVVLQYDGTGGISDYGFTTSTQGFIILGGNEMLMTRDAGATWQPVTLP